MKRFGTSRGPRRGNGRLRLVRREFRSRSPISPTRNRTPSEELKAAERRRVREEDDGRRAALKAAAAKSLSKQIVELPQPERSDGLIHLRAGRKGAATVLYAPEIMSAEDGRDELLGLILNYREQIYVKNSSPRGRGVVIDLSKVKSLDLGAALVLVSEYHRALINTNYKPTIQDAHWPASITALLEMLGFYDLVRPRSRLMRGVVPAPADRRFVPFKSGERAQGTVAADLIEALRGAAGQDPEKEYAYVALMEAMGNVRQHAYLDQPAQVFPVQQRWWSAGAFDPMTSTLQFAVYDQGVGIPETLRRKGFFAEMARLCAPELTDADIIAGAIRYSRSRHLIGSRGGGKRAKSSRLPGRGNGLWTICKLIPELPGSSVRIISGRGDVTFFSHRDVEKRLFLQPFCGSLIVWTLRLPLPQ